MSFTNKKITFALFFGNRGFFPGELIDGARESLKKAVTDAGYNWICMDESKTKYGAVETPAEGAAFAEFLEENKGKYDGVILSMPNFSDENGAIVAFKDVKVPILVQAFPDEIGLMDFAHRRDSMCGKFAMCNLLRQAGIPYSLTKKFTIAPDDPDFAGELKRFAALCRVVNGMRSFNLGTFGARTTAFKTVRVDEIALQNKGINVETIDLSEVFLRIDKVTDEKIEEKKKQILAVTEFTGWPEEKLTNMAKTQAAFEELVADYKLDAVAVRCWDEFQKYYGIAPCTSLSLLNEMGISAACEVDVENAIMMRALSLASDEPTMLLDYNNNYGDEYDKSIMFHCGPIAPSMLDGKGKIEEHLMFKKSYGDGSGVGINKGRIKSGNVTFGSVRTENGRIHAFVAEGEFTDDPIEEAFFGSGKVMKKETINDVANFMAENGYKHHIAITYGEHLDVICEAFDKYLDYDNVAL